MFPTLEDAAAAIALVEALPIEERVLAELCKRRHEIEAYARPNSGCHGVQIGGGGNVHRFFVKGTEKTGYKVTFYRMSTDAEIRNRQNKGWQSRPAIERAELLGIELV